MSPTQVFPFLPDNFNGDCRGQGGGGGGGREHISGEKLVLQVIFVSGQLPLCTFLSTKVV